jgi:hypothetical protein
MKARILIRSRMPELQRMPGRWRLLLAAGPRQRTATRTRLLP